MNNIQQLKIEIQQLIGKSVGLTSFNHFIIESILESKKGSEKVLLQLKSSLELFNKAQEEKYQQYKQKLQQAVEKYKVNLRP